MKFRSLALLFILFFTACTQPSATAVAPQSTGTVAPLPTVPVAITRAPALAEAANAFLGAWQAEDYSAMYALLTPASQDALPVENFIQRYTDVAINMTLQKIEYEILSTLTNPISGQVGYRVTFKTKMLGDFRRDMTMNLSLEKGTWRVQWEDGMILPELRGGNTLALDIKSPTRGNIYDKNGSAVAATSDAFAIGIVKGQTDPEQEGRLLSELSRLTGLDPEWIKGMYDKDYIYDGTYVPVAEVPADAVANRYDSLSGIAGLYMNPYTARFYFNGGIAPHVTGYVRAIQDGEQEKYQREGFKLDERVGGSGLERWGEKYLLGQRGATLYVNDPQGVTVTRLAQVDSKPSESVYMTIDSDLQIGAQEAINGFTGAIVVLERDSGRVLAMVSSPGFDPNAYETANYNWSQLLGMITGDGRAREYNRATGDGYPLGSVFKIITMAAGLESGIFQADDTYDCQHFFTEIPGVQLKDWTYDKEYDPSGVLTLQEGLMRSCNPWFYKIGMELYRQGHQNDISEMARAFGLGSPTGIDQVAEQSGNIPNPSDEVEGARIAIGQSTVLVNPLQVARFVAAVGNGGTLYRPQVVEKITDPDGKPSFTFKPEAQGTLPLKPENLEYIQEAMRWVVDSPRGTAKRAFSSLSIPVYGKTGTAETDLDDPHAWFAGYTDAGREDKPDIAFVVIAEYAGEGSEIAAPIARRILEVYFMGQPQRVYDWESRINVTRTPTPQEDEVSAPPEAVQPEAPQQGGNTPGGGNVPAADDGGFNLRTATPAP